MGEYLSTKELCEMFKVTNTAVMYWRKDGLPFIQINGRVIRYKKEEVEKWLNDRNKKFQ